MKGDFTRVTFEPRKRYTSVRMQQGRVQLDADWNEQADIEAYLDRTEATDVIGRSGAPKSGGSFRIGAPGDKADLTIAAGRFYVDGLLCELDEQILEVASFPGATEAVLVEWPDDDAGLQAGRWVELEADGVASILTRITSSTKSTKNLKLADDVSALAAAPNPRLRTILSYAAQPDFPGAAPLTAVSAAGRTDFVYLDVWEQEVTPNEDPDLLEKALGGADTAIRTRTVWQVHVREGVAAKTCAEITDFPPAGGDGVLTAVAPPSSSGIEPCLIPPSAGYRGLQNRFYRVEIHSANGTGPTYKWSRDNGASAFAIEEFLNEDATGTDRIRVRRLGRDRVLALAELQTIEVLDDDNALTGEPGTFVQIKQIDEEERVLTLSAKVKGYSVTRHARVRRWDGGPTPVDVGKTQQLEAGIELGFAGSKFVPGDYWLFAARTATGDIEPLEQAPPEGIRHHYAPLALVKWTKSGAAVTGRVEDCRALFPPLTDIAAEDVSFDNDCGLVTTEGTSAETVQEALDVLCAANGLQHHNAYLHGWGIVAGLKVVCDTQDRSKVVVRDGWVIDRAGNDVHISETPLPFMGLVDDFDKAPENTAKILKDGIGDAWLFWDPSRGTGEDRFGVEPYTSDWKKELDERLLETLLMEFYKDCVEDVQDFFRKQLTPPEGSKDPAGPQQERVAALSNLFIQRVNKQAGQHLLLTPREHEILKAFYQGLKDVLSLETFCGLFDDARPYPEAFPEKISGIDTIFGRGQHTRLRLRPGGEEAYSVGAGLSPRKPAVTINRWDLKQGKLAEQINPLAPQGRNVPIGGTRTANTGTAAVADIAISPDGKQIYIVAPTRNGEDTIFRVGKIGRREISWGDVFTICDLKIVTLATTAADPTKVYGIAQKRQASKKLLGDGIYRIDPAALAAGTPPVRVGDAFNAVGHMVIAPTGETWATEAAAGQEPKSYTSVRHFSDVTGSRALTVDTITLSGMRGKDDIAVFRTEDGASADTLYAIVETTSSTKFLLTFRGNTEAADRVPVEATTIRLEPYPPTASLLMTSEDGYCVRVVDMRSGKKSANFVPMQLGPIAIASDPKNDRVYVLNYLSSTLVVAEGRLFDPSAKFPLAVLAKYRAAAVNAYNDLLARFLEYLKDCLCEHLLVAEPDTTAKTKLYLGAVSIRKPKTGSGTSRVYKVCNLSRRRYVKSFPAIGHWLSLVPVLPFLDLMVERFCCWVLPDAFDRFAVAEFDESKSQAPEVRFRLGTARAGTDRLQAFDALGTIGGVFGKFLQIAKITGDKT